MSEEKKFPHVIHPNNSAFYITLNYDYEKEEYEVVYLERYHIKVIEKTHLYDAIKLSADIKKIQKAIYKAQARYRTTSYEQEKEKQQLIKALKLLKEQCAVYETDW